MHFLVVGRDGRDEGALSRRLATREAHIAACDALFEAGTLLFGVALLDDSDKMIGSSMVFDVENRDQMDDILAVEPYVVHNVWETVTVEPCRVGPTFTRLFDR